MAAKAKGLIKLDQTKKTVYTTSTLEYDQPIVFEFFNKVPADKYDETFMQALVLGCYALSQEKIAAMLDYTARELDGGLQSLRQLMDLRNMKQSGTAKGAEAEEDISTILQNFSDERQWDDQITATGNTIGAIPRRKVGDFTIDITVPGAERRIVVESKWDSSVQPGGPGETAEKESPAIEKTAYGQNISALANRNADIAIFVGDIANSAAGMKKQGRLQFLPEQPGFVVLVDKANGDWSLLKATYALCRTLVLMDQRDADSYAKIDLVVKRMEKDLERMQGLEQMFDSISSAAQTILDTAQNYHEERESIRESLEATYEFLSGWTESSPDALKTRNLVLGLSE